MHQHTSGVYDLAFRICIPKREHREEEREHMVAIFFVPSISEFDLCPYLHF